MEDAQGQTRVQDEPDGPEFHMEDTEGKTTGNHYGTGIEFMKVDHTIPEE